MILGTAFAIKILLPFVVITGGYFLLRKREKKARLACLGILVVLFALVSSWVSGFVPPLTDEVTLTALGEKREEALGEEVYLTGYTVDEKEYICGTDLKILDGKWFWSGETYCWRIETDPRQPEGVTRSVTVAIPVGWGRTLNFAGNTCCGMVEISVGGVSKKIDTYTVDGSPVMASIGRSATSALIWNQVLHLAVYGLVFSVLAMALYTGAVWKRERFRQFNVRHRGVLLFAAIALCQLAVAIKYSGAGSLWNDELWELGWSVTTPNLIERMVVDAVPRPISEFLLGAWIAIAPYGEKWLLLMPEVLTSLGIFFIGLCGKEYKGVIAGAVASGTAALSYVLMQQCSFEIRSYSMFFATSAVLLYLYIRRFKAQGKQKRGITVAMSIVMVIFAQTHYHAYVLCAALFFFDVLAHFAKVKKINLTPYLVFGVCTVPVAVIVLKSGFISSYAGGWQPVPSLALVLALIQFFAFGNSVVQTLFLFSIAVVLAVLMMKRGAGSDDGREKNGALLERFMIALPLFIMAFVIIAFYIYGKNRPQGTLWYDRYFIDLMPYFCVLLGFGVESLCEIAQKVCPGGNRAAIIPVLFFSLLVVPSGIIDIDSGKVLINQPFEEAADWIYTQSDNIYNDSTVILYTNQVGGLGWNRYYVERNGRRDPLNVLDQADLAGTAILPYDTVYVLSLHGPVYENTTAALNEYYEVAVDRSDIGVMVYKRL